VLLAKELVNEGDCDCPFANRRRDAFEIAATDVSDGKDAGTARFEEVRWSRKRPLRARELLCRELGSRFHKSLLVERYTTTQPARVGNSTGHHEHVSDVVRFNRTSRVLNLDPLELLLAFQSDDLRVGTQKDRRIVFDAPYEIPRHAVSESSTAH